MVSDGPNGPLMPEIHESAPHADFVRRKGEIDAWGNEAFVKTVRQTGKKTLLIAGVDQRPRRVSGLGAKAAGFRVYTVMDASEDPSVHVQNHPSLASRKPASFRPVPMR